MLLANVDPGLMWEIALFFFVLQFLIIAIPALAIFLLILFIIRAREQSLQETDRKETEADR